MSSDNEVRENAARTRIALLSSAFGVSPKGSSCQSPYSFWQLPIDPDSCLLKKGTDEHFAVTWRRDQFREHGGSSDQGTSIKCRLQGVLRR